MRYAAAAMLICLGAAALAPRRARAKPAINGGLTIVGCHLVSGELPATAWGLPISPTRH